MARAAAGPLFQHAIKVVAGGLWSGQEANVEMVIARRRRAEDHLGREQAAIHAAALNGRAAWADMGPVHIGTAHPPILEGCALGDDDIVASYGLAADLHGQRALNREVEFVRER